MRLCGIPITTMLALATLESHHSTTTVDGAQQKKEAT
jgi:hypothetical protein